MWESIVLFEKKLVSYLSAFKIWRKQKFDRCDLCLSFFVRFCHFVVDLVEKGCFWCKSDGKIASNF